MRTIKSKQDILDYLHQERAFFDALVAEVGEARMKIPGAMGEWTFHDLIAHLMAWWRREVDCIESIRRSEAPMPHPSQEHVEIINNWVYHTNRDRPLAHLLRDVDDVWQQFEANMVMFSESDLLEANRSQWYDGQPLGSRLLADFVDHYHNDHEADVETWLARIAPPEAINSF